MKVIFIKFTQKLIFFNIKNITCKNFMDILRSRIKLYLNPFSFFLFFMVFIYILRKLRKLFKRRIEIFFVY